MSIVRFCALGLVVFVAGACEAGSFLDSPLAPETDRASLTMVPNVTEVVAEIGPGSTFAIFKPAGWEDGPRELVVYAHGYVQPFVQPSLPTELDWFRDWLLQQGIAVAYSSYSHTGYAVKDGAQRTDQLRGLFIAEFGLPDVVHVVGISAGAMVASLLLERFTDQYDGGLMLCGVLAGGLSNARYIGHVRAVWDAYFPGTLEGSVIQEPEGYLVIPPDPASGYPGSAAFRSIVGTVQSNYARAAELARVDPLNLPVDVSNPDELIGALVHVLGYQVNGANDLLERLHGHSFFDNRETKYEGSSDDETLNAVMTRYEADPDAVGYLERWYTPTGQIDDPIVTLHTARDPLVPYGSEELYAQKVREEGNSDLLTRMPATDAFGHCAFEGPDVIAAFMALRSQVPTD